MGLSYVSCWHQTCLQHQSSSQVWRTLHSMLTRVKDTILIGKQSNVVRTLYPLQLWPGLRKPRLDTRLREHQPVREGWRRSQLWWSIHGRTTTPPTGRRHHAVLHRTTAKGGPARIDDTRRWALQPGQWVAGLHSDEETGQVEPSSPTFDLHWHPMTYPQ